MLRSQIDACIRSFIDNPEENTLCRIPDAAWRQPLIACAAGDDPLWEFYRQDIGGNYRTPVQWMRTVVPDAEAGEISVVSWVLPYNPDTLAEQTAARNEPAYRWALSRTFGEAFNRRLGLHVQNMLTGMGIPAIAPLAHEDFSWGESEKYGLCSNWSERHAAYVAGHGTFGLCDGLITPVGKAVRFGSVILRARLEPTPRPYSSHHEYCLYYRDGSCMACAKNCPAGAVGPDGHDKARCAAYAGGLSPALREKFGFEGIYGCGLCQVNVPCQNGIPGRGK